MARVGTKVMLAAATAAAMVLLAEGLVSLASNRSLARRIRDGGAGLERLPDGRRPPPPGDEDRRKAALTNPGLYRVHRDPLVGYVLKSDAEQQILEGTIHSDHLGLRARPGGPPPEGALRLVVAGDSVAFGYGLDDDETIAHQLETQLQAARAAGLPPVASRTVAMPGWNHRNSVHCLLDHLDELDPDVVVYMPVGNDLIDGDGVWESGHRRSAPDIASPDPWLQIGVRTDWPFLERLEGEVLAGRVDGNEAVERLGVMLLNSDLPRESRRRFEENAASIALLERALAARGARLLVVFYVDGEYVLHLIGHLGRAGVSAPQLRLFKTFPPELGLPTDPHPHAEAAGVMATWIGAELLRLGWVEGDAGRLPAVGGAYTALRSRPLSPEEVAAASAEQRRAIAGKLRPAVDFTTLEGIYQVYGTLNDDASVAMRLLLALAPGGQRVLVRLAPLEGRPDLYPLQVGVEIDGQLAGSIEVAASGPSEARFPLPPRDDAGAPVEVRLKPERWVTVPQGNSTTLASFRPLRIACESP